MSWTYTLTGTSGGKSVYAPNITDVENYDAVNWGMDLKLARVDRTDNDTGQMVTVYELGWVRGDDQHWHKKTASGPGDDALPGWVPGAFAAVGIVGAFAFGMWLLGKEPKKFGALDSLDLNGLKSRYKNVIGISQEPSGMVLVKFVDENEKEQVHDWFFDGKNWRCGLTGELQ